MNLKSIKAHPAAPAKTSNSQQMGIFLGVFILVMALCQLITFSKFVEIIYQTNLFPYIYDGVALVATLILFEILAVPFLLRLKISDGLRVTSMIMGWLIVLTWLFLSIWMWRAPNPSGQWGLFGTLIPLMAGPWSIAFSAALVTGMAWASWGLWPLKYPKILKNKKTTRKKPQ